MEIAAILSQRQFTKYLEVFASFEFGSREMVALLIHLYPFEMFLGADGKRIEVNGKDESLRRFKARMGLSRRDPPDPDRRCSLVRTERVNGQRSRVS